MVNISDERDDVVDWYERRISSLLPQANFSVTYLVACTICMIE